jgi:MFS family permease
MPISDTSNNRRYVVLGWLICLLAAVFYCYEYLLRIVPGALRPNLFSALHLTSMHEFGWLSAAYLVGYTPLQLFVGYWTDRYGSRRMLILALLLCVFGSFVFMFNAHQLWIAIIGRILVGAGSAFAFVAVLRLAAIWLDKKYFSFFVGLTTALGMLGAAFGYSLMTTWVKTVGADAVVAYSAYFGCALLPLFVLLLREKPEPANAEDVTLVDENRPSFWQNMRLLFTNSQVLLAGAVGGILFLSLAVMADNLTPAFLQAMFPDLQQQALVGVSRNIYFGWLIGAPLAGWLTELFKSRRWLLIAGVLGSVIVFSLLLFLPALTVFDVSLLLFLFGLFSSVEILCFTLISDQVAKTNVAISMSVVNFLVMLVSTCVLPLVTYLLDFEWNGLDSVAAGKVIRVYSLHAYHVAFSIIPILYAVALVLLFFLKESYHKRGDI